MPGEYARDLFEKFEIEKYFLSKKPLNGRICVHCRSIIVNGLKKSLFDQCSDVVIKYADILFGAPLKSIVSGNGDFIIKYVSICKPETT